MAEEKIWGALAAVQAQLRTQPHTRRVDVGRYGYTYTELSALADYLLPLLGAAGIATTYTSEPAGEASLRISCRLTADDGSHVEAATVIAPDGPDAQSVGKTLTYGRRYCLQMATGIATEADDDCAPAGSEHKPAGKAAAPATSSQAAPATNGAPRAQDAPSDAQRRAVFASARDLIGKEVPADEIKMIVEAFAKRELGVSALAAMTAREASKLIDKIKSATREDLIHADKIPF